MSTFQHLSGASARALSISFHPVTLTCCLVLVSCGGGDKPSEGRVAMASASSSTSAQRPTVRSTAAVAPLTDGQTLREEIARLEQQGVLPTLDRSTDIRGPDRDDNGVRDDIDAFVAALTLTEPQRRAVMQTARNEQAMLLADPKDAKAVALLMQKSLAATKCMGDVSQGAPWGWADEIDLKIEAITANTPERARRYIQFSNALSGTSTRYPSENTCEG